MISLPMMYIQNTSSYQDVPVSSNISFYEGLFHQNSHLKSPTNNDHDKKLLAQ